MKIYFAIILSILSCLSSYAYRLGEAIKTKEGDMGVIFYVDQDKVLLVSLKDTVVTCKFSTEANIPLGVFDINDFYEYKYQGRERTQEMVRLSASGVCDFPILKYIPVERGWFLPCATELELMRWASNPNNFISQAIVKMGGSKIEISKFLTCTLTYSSKNGICCVRGYDNGSYPVTKDTTFTIRPIYQIDLTHEESKGNFKYAWNTGSTAKHIKDEPLKTTTYSVVATNSENACKSTDSRTVIVATSEDQMISDTICEGETYTKYGFNETESGDYTKTIITGTCTTNVNLHLIVAPKYVQEFNDDVCLGKYYNKHGFSVTPFVKGKFHDTLSFISQMGCDSMVILNLNVNPVSYDTITKRICQNEDYKDSDFNISSYQKTGMNYFTVEKSTGNCKSYLTLALMVDPVYEVSMVEEVIAGDDYKENGFNIEKVWEEQVHKRVLTTINGCDSIINLKVVPKDTTSRANKKVITTSINDAICEGESYSFKGQTLTVSGVYTDTVETFTELDVTELTLFVYSTSNFNVYDTTMVGESYDRNGLDLEPFTEIGDFQYVVNSKTVQGCDSVVTVNLHVIPWSDNRVIPTVFSPSNQDNSNDVFMAGYHVTIYDRYGNLVSSSDDGWDGKRRGEYADPGVYVYVVVMRDGEKKRGTIEVLK